MASRDEIKRRVADYNTRAAAIRADKNLSPLGKRRALEQLYNTVKPDVDELRAALTDRETHDRRQLHQRLFGLPRGADPATVIAFRDAQDRVAGIKNPDALGELMERAASSGDDTLLRAAFGHAFSQSRSPLASDAWDSLVSEYARQNPAASRDLEAFTQASSPRGATAAFSEQMEMALRRPPELQKHESQFSDETAA